MGKIKFRKGILQGDSSSPLLFNISLEPISRYLNKNHIPGINCKIQEKEIKINHLLYIDDAKLFAPDQETLNDIFTIFKHLSKTIGYDLNLDKCYSNTEIQDLHKLEYKNTIKYLGIHENCLGKNTKITLEGVTIKIIERI